MMASSFLQIRLFVEGFYDKKFVERILAPRLSERYAVVQIHEYARAADETLRRPLQIANKNARHMLFHLGRLRHGSLPVSQEASFTA
jgi:hypothetical protein